MGGNDVGHEVAKLQTTHTHLNNLAFFSVADRILATHSVDCWRACKRVFRHVSGCCSAPKKNDWWHAHILVARVSETEKFCGSNCCIDRAGKIFQIFALFRLRTCFDNFLPREKRPNEYKVKQFLA